MNNRIDTIELTIDGKVNDYDIRELKLNDLYEYEIRMNKIVRYYISKKKELIEV
jgi:hypothetical protein